MINLHIDQMESCFSLECYQKISVLNTGNQESLNNN